MSVCSYVLYVCVCMYVYVSESKFVCMYVCAIYSVQCTLYMVLICEYNPVLSGVVVIANYMPSSFNIWIYMYA